ncbi:sigma 54-interacting transcriptional regulator [bacterium]|nr:sigma 54-interacting transcriptional regulator [bacterium]
MIDKRYRFGLFSSTDSLIDQVKAISADQNIDLEVSTNTMDQAIPDAKRMEAAGVEVLLSGTTTDIFLRENVKIPVIDFRLEALDVVENAIQASKKAKKIVIPILKKSIGDISLLGNLLGVEIGQFIYENAEGVRNILNEAKEHGYEMVIGGGYVTRYAREIGLSTIDYHRTEQSIRESIESAITIVRSSREAREKSHRYRVILDSASDGVIAVNEQGRITEINRTACDVLKINAHEVIHQLIDKVVPKTGIQKALKKNWTIKDSIEKFGNKTYVWNHRPFEVAGDMAGCVSTFNEISSVMRAESKIRRTLSKGHIARYSINDLLHQSDAMKETVSDARQYAKTDSNLLITGETGTGKEVLVQSIHNLSARRKFPFVSINCAALPDQLLESELFGYEEGAFTGSRKGGRAGLFEIAHKGTIFLDEIGETSQNLQIRLLRVLQEREIMRLGDDRLITIDVRVIAASNRDLAEEVGKSNFRRDLFFRLNILRIHIPPLRSRLDDIPVLLDEFINVYSGKNGMVPFSIPPSHIERLKKCTWPGNVRQLQNFTERLVLLSHSQFNHAVFEKVFAELIDQRLIAAHQNPLPQELAIPPVISKPVTSVSEPVGSPPGNSSETLKEKINHLTSDNERQILQVALERAKYSKTQTAKDLGISRSTLWKKLKKAGLN